MSRATKKTAIRPKTGIPIYSASLQSTLGGGSATASAGGIFVEITVQSEKWVVFVETVRDTLSSTEAPDKVQSPAKSSK